MEVFWAKLASCLSALIIQRSDQDNSGVLYFQFRINLVPGFMVQVYRTWLKLYNCSKQRACAMTFDKNTKAYSILPGLKITEKKVPIF